MSWHEEPLLAFDTETSGVDPFADRIVTASLVEVVNGQAVTERNWLINPGVEIPQAATNVHGITTYKAETEGVQPLGALAEIRSALTSWGGPLVVFNAAFDLTLLDVELERNGLEPVRDYRPVIDPFVIDKQADKYRKGKRTLGAISEQYGVTLDNAHSSSADSVAAAQVAIALAVKYPELQEDPGKLHDWQVKWRAQQCSSLQDYFRKSNPKAVVHGGWPIQEAA